MALSLALIAAACLIGSVSGNVLRGRWRGIDIRRYGSGNAGGSSALRTAGWRFALAVVVIDVGKDALAPTLLISVTQRGNLARRAAGSESRFERARVLRWRRRRDRA